MNSRIVAFMALVLTLWSCRSTDWEYLFGLNSWEKGVRAPIVVMNDGDMVVAHKHNLCYWERMTSRIQQIIRLPQDEHWYTYGFDLDPASMKVVYLHQEYPGERSRLVQTSLVTGETIVLFSSGREISGKSGVSPNGVIYLSLARQPKTSPKVAATSAGLMAFDLSSGQTQEFQLPSARSVQNLVLAGVEPSLYFNLSGTDEQDSGLYRLERNSTTAYRVVKNSELEFVRYDETSLLCFDRGRPFDPSTKGMFLLDLETLAEKPLPLPSQVDRRAQGEIHSVSLSPDRSRMVFYSQTYWDQDYMIQYLFEYRFDTRTLRQIRVLGLDENPMDPRLLSDQLK